MATRFMVSVKVTIIDSQKPDGQRTVHQEEARCPIVDFKGLEWVKRLSTAMLNAFETAMERGNKGGDR